MSWGRGERGYEFCRLVSYYVVRLGRWLKRDERTLWGEPSLGFA